MANSHFFLCDAVYQGSRQINGALTPSMLSSLADAFFYPDQSAHKTSNLDKLAKGDRCQLQIDEECLKVNCSRKDEGFESDSDTSSTHGSVERVRESQEVKVIKDHVLRLEKLIRQDSGISRGFSPSMTDRAASLSSSSGAESEEEATTNISSDSMKGRFPLDNKLLRTTISIDDSSGNLNTFWIRDILFCHVLSHRPKVVTIVIKALLTSITTAHVFECLSSEAARTLYSNYNAANNKYKLERYRNSRRMNDEKVSSSMINTSVKNTTEKIGCEEKFNKDSDFCPKEWSTQFGDLPGDNNLNLRNKTLNGKRSNATNHIEIKEGCSNFPYAMMQRTDSNGVTHIEIDSSPRGFPSLSSHQSNKNATNNRDALTALERLSLHSSNNPDSYLNYSGVTGSCPNSLIVTSREIARNAERNKKSKQVYPAVVLRNEFGSRNVSMSPTEIKRNNERRNRSKSEERKAKLISSKLKDEQLAHSLPYISSPRESRKSKFHNDDDAKYTERQSRSRSVTRNRDSNDRARSRNGKRQAPQPPPPPPRRHPDNPSLLLVPTKTGQEASKSYYPKESHNIRGNKIVRIDYPIYPPWNMNADVNNNPARVYYAPPSWTGYHEFHSSRNNDHHFSEMRKRSRSKSPARKPMGHRYIDAVSTLNISQRFKVFSDSVMNSIKPSNSSINGLSKEELQRHGIRKSKKSYEVFNTESGLKPVIKRGKKDESVGEIRRVTFNSYATVQVMD